MSLTVNISATNNRTAKKRTVLETGRNFQENFMKKFQKKNLIGAAFICDRSRSVSDSGTRGEQISASRRYTGRFCNRYLETDGYSRRAGQGRRRVTTPHDDWAINRRVRQDPFVPANVIARDFPNRRQQQLQRQRPLNICPQTVQKTPSFLKTKTFETPSQIPTLNPSQKTDHSRNLPNISNRDLRKKIASHYKRRNSVDSLNVSERLNEAVDKNCMEEAVNDVLQNNIKLREAARLHNICKSTLAQEERHLQEYLEFSARLNYGLNKQDIRILAYQYADANGKKVPEKWKEEKKQAESG
ncbi:unnamed protein product [Brassicogethes aeneus]|uniref:Uncharacterized protein n=1 Tax=Brassicogethes aeneus TaxID=1431903 RepID=A0A9P0BGR4_BRAAE|nr:unnamed protein product [Brassicogethes aeneus]